jgi:hypothetical protein
MIPNTYSDSNHGSIFFLKYTGRLLFNRIVLLLLQRFFIGYWILKTGLDVYSGPFLFVKCIGESS